MTIDDYILFFFNMDVNLSSKVASLLWMKAKRTAVAKGHMLQQGIHHTNLTINVEDQPGLCPCPCEHEVRKD